MLISYKYRGQVLKFVDKKQRKYFNNTFTILVGKNGTGKSRLLSKIITEFLPKPHMSKVRTEVGLFSEGEIEYEFPPKKIIAVSTSPFDKFPLFRNQKEYEGYSYLGIRELISHNLGLAYLSKIVSSLIEAIVQNTIQIREITSVLNYLGYSDMISIRLQTKVSGKFIKEILSVKDPIAHFDEIVRYSRIPFGGINRRFFDNEDQSLSKKKIIQLIKILRRIQDSTALHHGFSNLEIDRNGIHSQSVFPEYYEDLIFLLKSGVIKLQDVTLSKLDTYAPFSINEASSGEQSVVISILGIASQIRDNSLVCIDEPEVCLHPEWQERYIKILTSTFKQYKGCHFVIATHSPQIISNLNSHNSYILSLETGDLIDAKQVIRHSSDFQLAYIFNSPGFKNEFLIRIALNLFAKVSKKKMFDEDDLGNYEILNSKSELLEDKDPVLELFAAIKVMYQIYG